MLTEKERPKVVVLVEKDRTVRELMMRCLAEAHQCRPSFASITTSLTHRSCFSSLWFWRQTTPCRCSHSHMSLAW